jgi:Zn-dependent M28 family amino/carboxypeptidase
MSEKTDNRWLLLVAGFALVIVSFSPDITADLSGYIARLRPAKPTVPDLVNPDPEPVRPVTREDALNLVQASDIQQYVTRFAASDFAGRGTGQPGADKAAQYIMDRLTQLGVPYLKQPFHTSKGTATNIIGYLMPAKEFDDKIIVVGAHYDHLGGTDKKYYPGADDNASGVAGVLEIAEVLVALKSTLKHTVLFQFYSAEEIGLVGSAYYCNNPLFPRAQPDIKKHVAMINLDMIGYLRNQDEVSYTDMYRIYGGELPEDFNAASELNLKSLVGSLANKYSFANRVTGYRPAGSDHAPFYRKGVPVAFLHTGSHPHYHRVTDTPEKLNYSGAESVARLAAELALDVDAALGD